MPLTIKNMQAYIPDDSQDRFHLGLALLHGLGAIGACLMSLICKGVAHATHRAMIPVAIPIAGSNFSQVLAYRAAFPWSEDAEFETHLWNPFILIAAFEWLTAAFALSNTRQWMTPDNTRMAAEVWLGIGVGFIAVWYVLPRTREDGFCLAMLIILGASYLMTGIVIEGYYKMNAPIIPAAVPNEPNKEEAEDVVLLPADQTQEEGAHMFITVKARVWHIPRRIASLKGVADNNSDDTQTTKITFAEAVDSIAFRYAEYCITAPLLFLAIMCLLVNDAPAWLYLIGYWLIQACNALGIALHYNITMDMMAGRGSTDGVSKWAKGLTEHGIWADPNIQYMWLLCASWLCLAMPFGGIIYLSRFWLFSFGGEMPAIALIMIWLLIVSYTMFGLIPTAAYWIKTREVIQLLPWILDVLNLVAKFSIPWLVLISFLTRPAGLPTC